MWRLACRFRQADCRRYREMGEGREGRRDQTHGLTTALELAERRCVNPQPPVPGTWQANIDDLKANRLWRSLTARDSSRMHIFLRGLELVGEVVRENDPPVVLNEAPRARN